MDHPQSEVSSAEESRLVADAAYYLMVSDQRKYAIKKKDIIKNVFKEHGKQYKTIMKKVQLYLKEIAGISLVELEPPTSALILENKMKNSQLFAEMSKFEKQKMGFIVIILSLILMKEDFMPEDELWKALRKIAIDPDSKHPLFGDIKKFVTQDLVRQLYVQYSKQENSDPPVFIFSWGCRANLEVPKIEILQFVCDVFGDGMTPADWPNQYKMTAAPEDHTER